MIRKKKAIKSLSFLWIGSIFGSGSTFLIYTIIARELGPEIFGLFSSAMATITIFILISGFGISRVWLKLFGEEGWEALRWIKPSLNFVLVTLVFVSLSIITLTLIDLHDKTTNQLLLLLIFYIYGFVSIELVCSKFQLEEKYNYLAFWQLLPNLSRLVVITCGYYLFKISLSVIDIGLVYAIIGIVFTIIACFQLYDMREGRINLKGHVNREKKIVKIPKIKEIFIETWPFGLANLFAFIYIQSDIIMVKYISGDIETGYYNASFVILTAILMIPSILFGKFLMPKYHRWANHDGEKFYKVYKSSNKLMLLSGGVLMIIVYLTSEFFMPFIFGEEYRLSVDLMKILSFTMPISFLAYSVGATLVTKEHMKTKVKLMGMVAITNIILNIILIPRYGAKGAAIATISSNLVLLGMYYFIAKKRVFININ